MVVVIRIDLVTIAIDSRKKSPQRRTGRKEKDNRG